jgi:hypothetical protein
MINNTILVIFAVTAAFGLVTATLLVPAQAKVRAKLFCGKEAKRCKSLCPKRIRM